MDTTGSQRRPWQFSLRALFGFTLAVALLLATCRTYMRWKYPYGQSHCCDKQLMGVLENYARDHGGRYPSGEKTPEASLSLLYPKYAPAYLLTGKTVPENVVRRILEQGQRLGPETCGWHYVEGLTVKDDPRLAIFWDKAGLGHDGERLSTPGHWVQFIGWGSEFIPETEWAGFLEEQQKLLAERQNNTATAGLKP